MTVQESGTKDTMGHEEQEIRRSIEAVVDPYLGLPIGDASMVGDLKLKRSRLSVSIGLPRMAWPTKERLDEMISGVARAASIAEVDIQFVDMSPTDKSALRMQLRSIMTDDEGENGQGHDHSHGNPTPKFLAAHSTTRVIGISSGKGGVGKSSVTVNVAIALASKGHKVGLLDADVYGFSVPKMIGADMDPVILGDLVIPSLVHGVRVLSMGFFVPDEQPVIWRGPMLHKAIDQFLADAYWGDLDFLIVDMPPGTGDVTLSLAQVMPRTEIVAVTTPQPAASRVAQRSAFAAKKLKLSVRGVIENMSWFTDRHGTRYELFGNGGGQMLADALGVPLLGQIPLAEDVRVGGDTGVPLVVSDPGAEASLVYESLAEKLVKIGPARVYRKELSVRA
jgi:ATP-binding protein involved in chromosome partitioning